MTTRVIQARRRREEQSRSRRIEQAMTTGRMLDPAAVAYDILAVAKHHPERDAEIHASRARFLDLLRDQGQDDVLERRMQYAIRIASSGGELLLEEMYKLFSLCDQIDALKFLGLKVEAALDEEFASALRLRFKREKRNANIAAVHLFERWKTSWWYTENI